MRKLIKNYMLWFFFGGNSIYMQWNGLLTPKIKQTEMKISSNAFEYYLNLFTSNGARKKVKCCLFWSIYPLMYESGN